MTKTPYPGTQSIRRAMSLLKAFTDAQPEWGLTDLAQAVGLNKTTAYRLISALENEGMVARDGQTGAYHLGPGAIVLGGRALRFHDLHLTSRAELEELADDTGESATLEIRVDCDVLIVDQVQGAHVLGAAQEIATRWPAHATSTGKVLLAYLPVTQCEELFTVPLVRYTEKTITDLAELQVELAQVRAQGYATVHEELELGFVAAAAPIFNHNAEVIAAVSIGGPGARLQASHLQGVVNQVIQAAKRISERLGFVNSNSD
ncbi:MAG: IclR family transcriptional regulator [Chloroflexi bacterium]|nr:IclR family transcriptional regulator [Chloroflexota bacterium]